MTTVNFTCEYNGQVHPLEWCDGELSGDPFCVDCLKSVAITFEGMTLGSIPGKRSTYDHLQNPYVLDDLGQRTFGLGYKRQTPLPSFTSEKCLPGEIGLTKHHMGMHDQSTHGDRFGVSSGGATNEFKGSVKSSLSQDAIDVLNSANQKGPMGYEEKDAWLESLTPAQKSSIEPLSDIADEYKADARAIRGASLDIAMGEAPDSHWKDDLGNNPSEVNQVNARANLLHEALAQVQPLKTTIYRGAKIAPDSRLMKRLQVGKTIDIGVSSFSASKNVAFGYGNVVFEVDGARAIPMDALSTHSMSMWEQEFATGGRFVVEQVSPKAGPNKETVIRLRQTHTPATREDMLTLKKHYMGMHDQSTHGDRFGGIGGGGDPYKTSRPEYMTQWSHAVDNHALTPAMSAREASLNDTFGTYGKYREFRDATHAFASDPEARARLIQEARAEKVNPGSGSEGARQLLMATEIAPPVSHELVQNVKFNTPLEGMVAKYQPGSKLNMTLGMYRAQRPVQSKLRVQEPDMPGRGMSSIQIHISPGARALPIWTSGKTEHQIRRNYLVSGQFQVDRFEVNPSTRTGHLYIRQIGEPSQEMLSQGKYARVIEQRARSANNKNDIARLVNTQEAGSPIAALNEAPLAGYQQHVKWYENYNQAYQGDSHTETRRQLANIARNWPMDTSQEHPNVSDQSLYSFRSKYSRYLNEAGTSKKTLYAPHVALDTTNEEFAQKYQVGHRFEVKVLPLYAQKDVANRQVLSQKVMDVPKKYRPELGFGGGKYRVPYAKVMFQLEPGAKAMRIQSVARDEAQWNMGEWGSGGTFEVTKQEQGPYNTLIVHIKQVSLDVNNPAGRVTETSFPNLSQVKSLFAEIFGRTETNNMVLF